MTPLHLMVFALATTLISTASAEAAVTISSAATSNMSCVSGVCTPTAANAVLNVGDLTTMLASGNVSVSTGALGSSVEDILVTAAFNWTSGNSLSLDAWRSVTVSTAVADNGAGAVTLTTNDGGSGGYLSFISGGSLSFLGTSNSLTIGGHAYTLKSSISALARSIASDPSGFFALASNYSAKKAGTYSAAPIPTTFAGAFNGLGNTISGLMVNDKTPGAKVGLFAYIDTAGSVSSLKVTNAKIDAAKDSWGGILAGWNYGTVFNAWTGGRVKAATGKTGGALYGGLAGYNDGTISLSASSADVVAGGKDGSAFAEVGGLVGGNYAMIDESYATGQATVDGASTAATSGGLVELNNGMVENCYAEGDTAVKQTGDIGGLAGTNGLTISSAYSNGSAKGGKGSDIGGSLGYDGSSIDGGSVTNDYWDTTTSGITNSSQGAGNIPNDPGITGLTTAQLQAGLPAGFDPTIWAENPSINNGLPYLINNPPQ